MIIGVIRLVAEKKQKQTNPRIEPHLEKIKV